MLIADPATGELVPAAEGPTATLYVCGITPYDATHLGHAATYVAFDLLHRAWLDQVLTVRYASNVTDVDDPLLDRAREIGMDWAELAAQQTDLFAQDMTALGVLAPHPVVGVLGARLGPVLAEGVDVAADLPLPLDVLHARDRERRAGRARRDPAPEGQLAAHRRRRYGPGRTGLPSFAHARRPPASDSANRPCSRSCRAAIPERSPLSHMTTMAASWSASGSSP